MQAARNPRRMRWLRLAGSVAVVLFLLGCRGQDFPPPPAPPPPSLPQTAWPAFADDLDRASLQKALQASLAYLQRLPADRLLPLGDRQIPVARLVDTLVAFARLLAQAPTPAALAKQLPTHFELVQAAGHDGQGEVLFTGYYEPILPGSLVPTPEFTYPLYGRPPDLLQLDLGAFHPRFAGEQIVARLHDGKLLPYFTRRDIDAGGKLRGQGLELVWLRDAVDGFILHLQGSGQIRLRDGRHLRVHYAASNGHPYRSLGELLRIRDDLPPEALTLQGLRRYLRAHPQEQELILHYNPRYVFFRFVDEGPLGNLGIPLVPGRSIALDQRLFPPAGLAFIDTQQPRLDAQGTVTGWQPLRRFVFTHDTGGAITGPGRADLFWGSGEAAEAIAGRWRQPGRLFFLLLRQPRTAARG
ncbi:MAG: transglycosylase [Candidatus Tectimicrobiota bacterium]|nr:MAG: transglycosylase [Candidatus Tectomicrobia bacterium]